MASWQASEQCWHQPEDLNAFLQTTQAIVTPSFRDGSGGTGRATAPAERRHRPSDGTGRATAPAQPDANVTVESMTNDPYEVVAVIGQVNLPRLTRHLRPTEIGRG